MQALKDIQPTFGGGELTPALWGRIDIQKYKAGLRAARNVTILPQGGVRNRAGTQMIAAAGDSTHSVRLIPFITSTSQAYILELGNFYMRFYTLDGQVQVSGVGAYNGGTSYVPGNLVSSGGVNYYCTANTVGNAPPNASFWYPLTGTIMQIPTVWASADIFNVKFAQSANVLYLGHQSYVPQQLTFTNSQTWTIGAYPFTNGPFLPQNTDTTSTITPSGISGSITLTASKSIFASSHVGALFELLATVNANTITPSITASGQNWINTGTGASSYSAVITGTWSGTILIQTSPDNITWTTVQTVTTNGTYTGNTGFSTFGYFRAIMQSSLAFSGSANVVLTGVGTSVGPTALPALNSATASAAAGDTARITLTSLSGTGDTVKLQRSDDGGATWNDLATYTTNQAGVSVATTKTTCLIRAIKTIHGGGNPSATVDGTTGAAPTLTETVSSASVSQAIQCGANWSAITSGTSWTGKLRVEISTDGGNNWSVVQTFYTSSTGSNFNTSGQTGVSQCLLRVSSDPTVAFTGTCTIDLTSQSFSWVGVVSITAYASGTSVTATVQSLSNTSSTGLANTAATWQWSEGAWSAKQGYPSAVCFYQDRLVWAGPQAANVWFSQTTNFTNFFVNSPIQASDSINVVLASRQLNQVQNMIPFPQGLLCLTSEGEFALGPGVTGTFSATSVNQQPQGHWGSQYLDPVVVGIELIMLQRMGSIVRDMIFQLAVNGFSGDPISLQSQHLLTGFGITQMAFQQEPDSVVWMVRSDGQLVSLTYIREQELQAWTRHDTSGSFESVAVIPNTGLNIQEVWFVVNRTINGVTTRFIEVLKPRDQGINVSSQWFVDCGLQYTGAPANVITGLSHLNGAQVSVLADGFVLSSPNNPAYGTPLTVAGGQITLPNGYQGSNVIVGLPFVSDIGTLDAEMQTQDGYLQARRVKLAKAKLRVWNTRGLWVSTSDPVNTTSLKDVNGNSMSEIIVQNPAGGGPDQVVKMDTAMALFTGIVEENLPSGFDYGAHINIRQVDPLPMTILDIMSSVMPSDFL